MEDLNIIEVAGSKFYYRKNGESVGSVRKSRAHWNWATLAYCFRRFEKGIYYDSMSYKTFDEAEEAFLNDLEHYKYPRKISLELANRRMAELVQQYAPHNGKGYITLLKDVWLPTSHDCFNLVYFETAISITSDVDFQESAIIGHKVSRLVLALNNADYMFFATTTAAPATTTFGIQNLTKRYHEEI